MGQPALAERLIGSIEKALAGADETGASTLHMMIDWLHGASALYAGTPQPFIERERGRARAAARPSLV